MTNKFKLELYFSVDQILRLNTCMDLFGTENFEYAITRLMDYYLEPKKNKK